MKVARFVLKIVGWSLALAAAICCVVAYWDKITSAVCCLAAREGGHFWFSYGSAGGAGVFSPG